MRHCRLCPGDGQRGGRCGLSADARRRHDGVPVENQRGATRLLVSGTTQQQSRARSIKIFVHNSCRFRKLEHSHLLRLDPFRRILNEDAARRSTSRTPSPRSATRCARSGASLRACSSPGRRPSRRSASSSRYAVLSDPQNDTCRAAIVDAKHKSIPLKLSQLSAGQMSSRHRVMAATLHMLGSGQRHLWQRSQFCAVLPA